MRGWLSLAGAWIAAAVAVTLSTQVSLVTRLIFHFHPIAIAVGAAWLYRRLSGDRPCTAHAVAFLIGVAALLSASATALSLAGLTDPDWVAGPIALAGLVAAGWVLFRRSDGPVRADAGEEA